MQDSPLHLRVFGLDAEIALPETSRADLEAQWAWCLPEAPQQRDILTLEGESTSLASDRLTLTRADDLTEGEPHEADYRVTTSLTSAAITRRSGTLVMLHAGAVANASGRVVALVAASGMGKTTATHHLCTQGGFAYLTDETLITNAQGEVMPYPKPLSVVIDPDEPHHKSQHGPDELGMNPPPDGPLSLGPFVLLERIRTGDIAETDPPSLDRVGLVEGLTAILPQSSAMPDVPGCLDLLARLAYRGGGIHALSYSEISETLPLVGQLFDLDPIEPDWHHIPGRWDAAGWKYGGLTPLHNINEITLKPQTELVRSAFVDALFTDDEELDLLVLIGNVPVRLRGIGAGVWLKAQSATTLRDLTQDCVDRFGEHPQAETLVEQAVRELLRNRALDLA